MEGPHEKEVLGELETGGCHLFSTRTGDWHVKARALELMVSAE